MFLNFVRQYDQLPCQLQNWMYRANMVVVNMMLHSIINEKKAKSILLNSISVISNPITIMFLFCKFTKIKFTFTSIFFSVILFHFFHSTLFCFVFVSKIIWIYFSFFGCKRNFAAKYKNVFAFKIFIATASILLRIWQKTNNERTINFILLITLNWIIFMLYFIIKERISIFFVCE